MTEQNNHDLEGYWMLTNLSDCKSLKLRFYSWDKWKFAYTRGENVKTAAGEMKDRDGRESTRWSNLRNSYKVSDGRQWDLTVETNENTIVHIRKY